MRSRAATSFSVIARSPMNGPIRGQVREVNTLHEIRITFDRKERLVPRHYALD
jgi:hypothetical protein